VLSGPTVPAAGDGTVGDFYLQNPGSNPVLYGPKAASWPAGVSLLGVSGYNTGTGTPINVSGGSGTAVVTCTSGQKIIGGGYELAGTVTDGVITQNRATNNTTWSVTLAGGVGATTLTAYAYCAYG
jgi:hypothetical protein